MSRCSEKAVLEPCAAASQIRSDADRYRHDCHARHAYECLVDLGSLVFLGDTIFLGEDLTSMLRECEMPKIASQKHQYTEPKGTISKLKIV